MPLHLALKEIERLRGYEARMLAEKREEMKATRTRAASNFAKRSQGMGAGSASRDVSEKSAEQREVDLAKRSQILRPSIVMGWQTRLSDGFAERSQQSFNDRIHEM